MKSKTREVGAPAKYAVGDSVTVLNSGYRSSAPRAICTVTKIGKRDMTLSDGTTCRIHDGNVRATEPSDAEEIRLANVRKAIDSINANDLDVEALNALGPAVVAWKRREKRRRCRAIAMLRTALLDGPITRGEAASVTRSGFTYDDTESLLREAGVVESPYSKQHGRIYQRDSTREDRIDAVLLRELDEKALERDGLRYRTFLDLLKAVAKDLDVTDSESLRKDVIESTVRVGVDPRGGEAFNLQAWEPSR